MNVARPNFESVALKDGLHWTGGGPWLYQEKVDGWWMPEGLPLGNHVLVAEDMRNGIYIAHDLYALDGNTIAHWPMRDRWRALCELSRQFPPHIRLVQTGSGGEFLQYVIAMGKEGVVAKHLDAPFGRSWVRCKRQETYDCTITAKHPERQSVRLSIDGEDVGWCPILGRKFDQVQPGMMIEVAAHSRHPSGRLREPRFKQLRPDKEGAL